MIKHETKITIYIFGIALVCAAMSALSGCADQKDRMQMEAQGNREQQLLAQTPIPQTGNHAKVYFTTDISPTGLTVMYEELGRKVSGKVAVKISTGELGGYHFLSPDLIKDLVQSSTALSLKAIPPMGDSALVPPCTSRSHRSRFCRHRTGGY